MIGESVGRETIEPRKIPRGRRMKEEHTVRAISVTSGKGGVGKTHLTINVGLALAKAGKKVLLLDADLGLANIHVMLGFEPKRTLYDVLQGKATLNDVIVSLPFDLDVIPASSGIHSLTQLSEEERLAILGAVEQLEKSYDYVLVDTAAGIGDNVLYFNSVTHDVLVVVDEEPTSLTDAYALIKVLAAQCRVQEFLVVCNRVSTGTDGKSVFAQLAAATDRFLSVRLQYLGSVTDDECVPKAIVAQKPFLQLYPGSRASWDMMSLAKRIIALPPTRAPKGGMQLFFQELLDRD